ncbi:hypothetical protein PINS_up005902 [Pythium insidiosum]|nr:hypothetical protein PINS_up005902 [Pythium insidiosum]
MEALSSVPSRSLQEEFMENLPGWILLAVLFAWFLKYAFFSTPIVVQCVCSPPQ